MADKLPTSILGGMRLSNVRVLDLGVGLGDLSSDLLALGCEVIPVELPTRWSLLGSRSRAQSDSRKALQADGELLPLADQSVDVVISLQNLEHVANPRAVVEEIFRVLKPGGQFYAAWQNDLFNRQPIEQFLGATGFESVGPEKMAEGMSALAGQPSRVSRVLGAVSPELGAACDRWFRRFRGVLQTVSYIFVTRPFVPAGNVANASETLFALGTALNQHRPVQVQASSSSTAETVKHKIFH